ncbi:hypothetical protein, partial [Streptococcus agalactiae]|uniref:hypothetical protein n=1 Tax=Streptococcus agalactiae TaxID=1311 RepID=UPI001E658E26
MYIRDGVGVAYSIDRKRRGGLVGRVSSPLGPGLREAALGVEWQPTRLPLRLVAEQRFAIAGGRGGPALGAFPYTHLRAHGTGSYYVGRLRLEKKDTLQKVGSAMFL